MAHQKFKNRNPQKSNTESLEDANIPKKHSASSKLQETLLMSLALFTIKASTTFATVYKTRNKFQMACLNFSNKIQRARSWLLEESARLREEAKSS